MRASTLRQHRQRVSVAALFRNNMFVRWMAVFSIITAISIAMFSHIIFSFISRSMIETQLENQHNAMARVGEYLIDRYEFTQAFMNNIYRDSPLSNDLVNYLRLPFEDYVRQRLDQSFHTGAVAPGKITEVVKNTLKDHSDIQHILLYSAERQYLHMYSQDRNPQLFPTNAALSYIPDVMAMEFSAVSAPNIWIRKATQIEDRLISMRVPVNDPRSMLNIGQLLFYFRMEALDHLLADGDEKLKGYIVILSLDGQVIFDSSDRYYGKPYPYMDKISGASGRGMLEADSYYTIASHYANGFIVAGIAPVKELAASYQGIRRMVVVISVLCILIVVLLPSLVVVNFAKRTHKIIRFMRRAEGGDLSARLPEDRGDELGQISRSFNKMMAELSRHIERVYKAEIKQKHTELTALQARVQPHFLYNTLEVIRMRAVASGNHDVADMIYSLAMLFKSFVRPEHRTTLQEELENCRLYLELFRIRYQDQFSYAINYDPSLGEVMIVRMLIQPVIENYIVHGLRKDRKDNHISIQAFRHGKDVVIEVRDNGKGISEQREKDIAEGLKRQEDGGHSFGLRSIHQRLELLYGAPYGIKVAGQKEGTVVTLTLPHSESAGDTDRNDT